MIPSSYILGMRVDAIDRPNAVKQVLQWIREPIGRYICVANVHMCMESHDSPNYQAIVNQADMVVADGRPLVWALKRLKQENAAHVRGSDLMADLCLAAGDASVPVGLFGSTTSCLDILKDHLSRSNPNLKIACDISPPFRPMTKEEKNSYYEQIRSSGAKILFVGLGCPKQELFMNQAKAHIPCVMVGVGAAFDFISNRKKQAPRWMQESGLEWLFRFASEPLRLWKRYLKHNSRFLIYFSRQLNGN